MLREGTFYLRVKIKSLDEEIRIIRKEINRAKKSWNYHAKKAEETQEEGKAPDYEKAHCSDYLKSQLILHMVEKVKPELRCALIALAFVKGKPYSSVERYTRKKPNWERIRTLAIRYGEMNYHHDHQTKKTEQAWVEWYQEAQDHIFLTNGCQQHLKEERAKEGREEREEKLQRKKESTNNQWWMPANWSPEPKPIPAKVVQPQTPPEKPKGILGKVGSLFA